jgi:GST-like protein
MAAQQEWPKFKRRDFGPVTRERRHSDEQQQRLYPTQVWKWERPRAGEEWRYSGINRPIAGPTHDAELPVGKHPLQLYSRGTPNGVKVTVMLEELLALGHSGAEYDAWLIDIGKGEQFGSGFVDVNPNSKIPVLVDRSGAKPRRVFESGSILLYLAEKFGAFLPSDADKRTEALNWLFWQMGSTPYVGGGFGHFYHYAPVKIEYAINRFAMEAKRQLDVLNRHLKRNEYMAGDEYTIADMAIWPWYGSLAQGTQVRGRRVPAGAGVRPRHALDQGDRRAPRRQARPDGQPRRRRSCPAAARAP